MGNLFQILSNCHYCRHWQKAHENAKICSFFPENVNF